MKNDSERIEFLSGQVHALINAVTMLVAAHHDPIELKEHFEAAELVGRAKVEGHLVSETYIAGIDHVNDQLRGMVEETTQEVAKRGDTDTEGK